MSKVNVYDFDKTIYKGDCTLDFYLFCLKIQPLLLFVLPIQIFGIIRYKLKLCSKLEFKERFYVFLKYLNNREQVLEKFWDLHEHKIQTWYLKQQKPMDIIISASPQFLLNPICKRLNIKFLIASIVDIKSGKCISENCFGEEKVKRLYQQFEQVEVLEFYSDSLTDTPLANIAKESYGVIGERIIPWIDFEKLPKQRSWMMEFLFFLIVGIINTFNGVAFASLFTIWFNSISAFLIGYLCSLIISYILNSLFVFNNKLNFKKFMKFCVSYIPNFAIQFMTVTILLKLLEVQAFFVYVISACIGVPITFLIVKFFALKK